MFLYEIENVQRVKTETGRKVTEQVFDFIYLGNMTLELKKILILNYKDTTK
jgi:hypothetical protein